MDGFQGPHRIRKMRNLLASCAEFPISTLDDGGNHFSAQTNPRITGQPLNEVVTTDFPHP